MAKTMKRNFKREVASALASLFEKHAKEELTLQRILKLILPSLDKGMVDGIREKAVAGFIGEILRSQDFTDDHGEKVRRFHSYKKFEHTDDGKEKQLDFWKSIDTMDRDQMIRSAKARLQQAQQLRERVATDVRYWDAHVAPTLKARPIAKQLHLLDE
jgi:hypothetical protein